MPAQMLETQVHVRSGVAIIDLRGEIDALAEDPLNAGFRAATRASVSAGTGPAAAEAPRAVLLNFADVKYINSTGIALIVGLLARARKAGLRVLTCGLSEHYVEIFRITRLADFMTLCEDEAAALAEVNRS